MFWIKNKLRGLTEHQTKTENEVSEKGLVIFYSVEEAIQAERLMRKSKYTCKLVAPPPNLRKGCDLALEIKLVEQPAVERLLKAKVDYVGVYPLAGTAELLQIVKVTHFKNHTMVKAGNMKITYDNSTGIIVNTSGGGCPDIPHLYLQLVGKNLLEAPRPKDIGFTLCALMLDRALEESISIWKGEHYVVDSRDCAIR